MIANMWLVFLSVEDRLALTWQTPGTMEGIKCSSEYRSPVLGSLYTRSILKESIGRNTPNQVLADEKERASDNRESSAYQGDKSNSRRLR